MVGFGVNFDYFFMFKMFNNCDKGTILCLLHAGPTVNPVHASSYSQNDLMMVMFSLAPLQRIRIPRHGEI